MNSTSGQRKQKATDRLHAGLQTLSDLSPLAIERLRARFAAKVVVQANGCHEWVGAKNSSGYGCIGIGCRKRGDAMVRAAHRVAWLLERGDIGENLVIDHTCRNRVCVNVAHLEPVTHGENVRRGKVSLAGRERAARRAAIAEGGSGAGLEAGLLISQADALVDALPSPTGLEDRHALALTGESLGGVGNDDRRPLRSTPTQQHQHQESDSHAADSATGVAAGQREVA